MSSFNRPIYLDYAATTPVDPRVVQAMVPRLAEHFGNPASNTHAWGWEAEEAVEQARSHVAALIGAQARDVVWTSGATESNNLAITGAALAYQDKGRHLITLKTEHKAVLDTMRALEQQGFAVTFLDVQPNGLVDLSALQAAMRPDTILVSVMAVNNEIGVVHDSAAIGQLCRQQGVLFHVDAAQATGKAQTTLLPESVCHVTSSLEPLENIRIDTSYRDRGDGFLIQGDPVNLGKVDLGANFNRGGAYYLAARFRDDFEAAVLHAVNGGGQNLARAMLTGALVGAQVGLSGIPARFVDGLEDGAARVGLARQLAAQLAG